jgi:hypothetical protein
MASSGHQTILKHQLIKEDNDLAPMYFILNPLKQLYSIITRKILFIKYNLLNINKNYVQYDNSPAPGTPGFFPDARNLWIVWPDAGIIWPPPLYIIV